MAKKTNLYMGALLLVAVLALGIFAAANYPAIAGLFGVKQVQLGTSPTNPNPSPSTSCAGAYIFPSVKSTLAGGSSPSPVSYLASINGAAPVYISSTTALPQGAKVDLLLNSSSGSSNYIAKIYTNVFPNGLACGPNSFVGDMYLTGTPSTEQIVLTNNLIATHLGAAGTNNETGTTADITNTLRIVPVSYGVTGDIVVVIETNSSRTSDITSNVMTPTNLPKIWHSAFSGTGTARAFTYPSTSSREELQYTLKYASSTLAQQLVNVTVYQSQAFLDKDNTFKVGIEDSQANAVFANVSSVAYGIN